jgi:hypothetical protein
VRKLSITTERILYFNIIACPMGLVFSKKIPK